MRIFFLAFFVLFLQTTTSQNLEYQSLIIDENLTKNANAVVRLDEMIVEISAIDHMLIKQKRVVTVLNNKGEKHIHGRIWYDNGRKVKKVQAIIYNALGNEIDKIKEKDFKDVSGVRGGTLYSDSRVKYMEYTPTKYPYTVEFTSEITTSNTGYIPTWYFLDGFMVSVEKSSFEIIFSSKTFKPNIKEYNLDKVAVKKKDELNSIAYNVVNIPAVKWEELTPSFGKMVPKVVPILENFNYEGYKGSIKDWKGVGSWMYSNMLTGKDKLSPATIQKVKSLVNGVEDKLERAKIIYKYVQDNTRYISVQVGVGGIQPISAIDVDKVKYGDCKGLSNYTKALLNAVGVSAYYTHVQAGNNKVSFDADFPYLWSGNHVILAIPYKDNYYWIDCTSQVHPFGFIGDFTDDRKVLMMKPEGGELVTTTSYLNKQNYQKINATYVINEKGGIEGDILIETRGIRYNNRLYLEDKKEDDIINYYKKYWSNINNLKINKHGFSNDKEAIVFKENITVSAVNYATVSGERLLFVVNAFNKNTNIPNRYRNRKLPFEIQRGYLDEDEFLIKIPEKYVVESLPNAKNVETKYGVYKIIAELQEDKKTIRYKRSLLVKKGLYNEDEYAAYRSFRKEIANLDNVKTVLIKIK